MSFEAYGELLTAEGFASSLALSLGLGLATIVLVLLLTLPAMLAVRLSAPRLRPVMEVLCTLPLVVPPITFVAGLGTSLRTGAEVLAPTPFWATLIAVQDPAFPIVLVLAYVVLVLPFVYRSLDAGLRTMDVRTLVEAARNLGASWPHVLFRVIVPEPALGPGQRLVPDARPGLGEFTVARLLGYQPFAVWIVTISGSRGQCRSRSRSSACCSSGCCCSRSPALSEGEEMTSKVEFRGGCGGCSARRSRWTAST